MYHTNQRTTPVKLKPQLKNAFFNYVCIRKLLDQSYREITQGIYHVTTVDPHLSRLEVCGCLEYLDWVMTVQ